MSDASRSPAMTSEKAPERIWAVPAEPKWGVMQGVWDDAADGQPHEVEYVRADVADAMVVAAYEAAKEILRDPGDDSAERALNTQLCCSGLNCGCWGANVKSWLMHQIGQLTPDDARAALADAERKAWEAGRDAALEAAKAEMLPKPPDNDEDRAYNMAVLHISDAIAALKKEPEA